MFAAVVAISVQVPVAEVLRSILKPVSLLLASVQARLICEEEKVVAVNVVGTVGAIGNVVALTMLVLAESPPVLVARTR